MAKYEEVIAGTDIEKNPELPAPKKIVGYSSGDRESGQIEAPIKTDSPIPILAKAPSPPPKIKKFLSIRQTDNGYVMNVNAGDFNEEWVFLKLSKVLKTIAAFFTAGIIEEE